MKERMNLPSERLERLTRTFSADRQLFDDLMAQPCGDAFGKPLNVRCMRGSRPAEDKPDVHSALPESLTTFELDHDELRSFGDILRKVNVRVTAAELTRRNRSGLGGAIREREVEGLVGKEDGATGGMPVHDRFLARTVLNSNEAHQFVFKRHRVVTGVRSYSIWNCYSTALSRQCHHADSEHNNKKDISHSAPLS